MFPLPNRLLHQASVNTHLAAEKVFAIFNVFSFVTSPNRETLEIVSTTVEKYRVSSGIGPAHSCHWPSKNALIIHGSTNKTRFTQYAHKTTLRATREMEERVESWERGNAAADVDDAHDDADDIGDDGDNVDDNERERHHGQKSWDDHGTKGAGQAANQQAEKYKNERHHTYATFLFRNVRHVSHLTGKSNVTNKVHASGMTS